jgi:hypothetical protein
MPESIAGEAKVYLDPESKFTVELKLQNDFTLTWKASASLPYRTPFVLAHEGKLNKEALTGRGLINGLEAVLSTFIEGRVKLSDETRRAIKEQLNSGKVIELKNHRKGVKSWQS